MIGNLERKPVEVAYKMTIFSEVIDIQVCDGATGPSLWPCACDVHGVCGVARPVG